MPSFELRWPGIEAIDTESLAMTAILERALEPEERALFSDVLNHWESRAEMSGFGEWEGATDPTFFDGAEGAPPIATWTFDASSGDHERELETLVAWLELFVNESGVRITHLVMGWWEPEDPIPTLSWHVI